MPQIERDGTLVHLGVRVEAGDRDTLVQLAQTEDRSLSNYVRGVLRRHLETVEADRKPATA